MAVAALAGGLTACEGCRSTPSPEARAPAAEGEGSPPTVRFYFVTDLAGALEPCGCTKDQLGGLDHFAAWVRQSAAKAPTSLVVSAGPLFFMDEQLDPQRADQDRAKADTLAAALRGLGFTAFAPGQNDWADGAAALAKRTDASGAVALVPRASGGPFVSSVIRQVPLPGGPPLKVAFVGYGQPQPTGDAGASPGAAPSPEKTIHDATEEAKAHGAAVVIALVSVGRGEAKRIADAVPDLAAVVVGSPRSNGDANTESPPVERVGDVLIAQAANHLQSVAVLDLYVRDRSAVHGGVLAFADGTGLELAARRDELLRRIDDLHVRIAGWERDHDIQADDLAARRRDLAKLEAERDALDVKPAPPTGNFFRYSLKEIRASLGEDSATEAAMRAYYKAVDDHNRVEFAGRLPPIPGPNEATYVGVEVCSSCHPGPRQVWNGTRHAHAYATLATQFKEFNLDCVECHVTGYERPGGSTVTHVDKLENVQCEVCHGPGSKHVQNPSDRSLIVAKPAPSTCLTCHHPPHVERFDAVAKMSEILGPGHGQPSR